MRARVALTTPIDPEGGWHKRPTVMVYANYVDALERVGLAPVLITPAHDPDSIRALLHACDGLVLSGGGDIAPMSYGEEILAELDAVSADRDAMERFTLDEATGLGLPVLGICRGLQLINVHRGGTLIQDLPTQKAGDILHNQRSPWNEKQHDVTIEPGSRLAEILGAGTIRVNSFHHQAVKDLGQGLVVTAYSPDGLVEGLEAPDQPWMLAVQWHLERQVTDAGPDDPDVKVLAAFAAVVQARADARV